MRVMEPPVDPELLERYILGRASEEERRRLDRLLGESPAWREALRSNLAVIEGVRRAGREGLKERLRSRTTELPRPSVPWTRVLAAAAVMVVIAGIAVLNTWLPGKGPSPPAVTESVTHETGAANEQQPLQDATRKVPTADRESSRPGRAARQEWAEDEKLRDSPAPGPAEPDYAQDRNVLRDAAQLPDVAEESAADRRSPAERERESPTRTATAPYAAAAKTEAPAGLELQHGSLAQTAWSSGVEFPADRRPAAKEQFRAEDKTGRSLLQTIEAGGEQTRIRVSQAPLAVAQQRKDAAPERFPVSFAQAGDTLEVTLYLDPPLDGSSLQQARVQQLLPDSLLIAAGSRLFGVRIPGSLLQQQRQHPVRLK